MMYKVVPVKQSCFSRLLEITVRAGDDFSTTTRRPFCNDTRHCGYTIFRLSSKSPSAVRKVTAGKCTMKFSPKPVSFTMLWSVPLQPTSFDNARTQRKNLHEVGHTFPYLPELSPVLAGHEVPQPREAFLTEAGEIDNLRTRLQTPQRSYDLDTLLQVRQAPLL